MDKLLTALEESFGTQRITQNEPLIPYLPNSDLKAPYFISVNSKEELVTVVTIARLHNTPFFIIDNDNDQLQKKEVVSGIVIKNNARKFDILARKGKIQSRQLVTAFALLEAESGVPLSQLVRYSIEEGLGGIEELLGVSGTVGRNLRTEDMSTSQNSIQSVTILTPENEIKEIEYSELKKDLIVLSVVFKLIGEDTKILWYKARLAAEKRGITEYSTA